ncbi:type II toxin-antitoxin system RelE/ParE family toxin [Methylosinus trichosporium]|uniref:type II toxin-antitoxin system RelE/ParE family toxin n=1 Tax=Methylosinus TaxID=425 RepID=UPI001FCE5EFF|nr:type II toxin-antitoxin system RelE/ParE family toxin [Methylosinus trichosporium]
MRRRQHHRQREEAISRPLDLRLTDTAEADLAEIWAYVADDSSEATATRLLEKIYAVFHRLQDFPLSGADRRQLAAGLRVTFHGGYAVYYLPTEDQILIVRVLHGARDAAAIADAGGFLT